MQSNDHSERVFQFIRFATFTLVVAILYFAREVLLPVAFAVLFAFLLSPLVVRLTRWGLPKGVAIISAVTLTFAIIGGMGWLVTRQVWVLVQELPNYEQNLQSKIRELKNPTPGGLSRTGEMVDKLRKQLEEPTKAAAEPFDDITPAPSAEPKPVPVEVRAPPPNQFELTRELIAPVLGPLGLAGLVIVLVVAILFQREDLRSRFIELVSAGKINLATQALDDAARRVGGYLWMQLVVNATYGIPVGAGLYFIGVPGAFLWGLIATLLRFVPFIGPWIAAAFPVTLAFAVDPGWSMLLWTLALFGAMELISNNIIEVILYRKGTGISTLALLIGAVFWTWLWGTAGLILATPMTVCLLVLGKYVPSLKFLSMLLGSEPAQAPPAMFYQRLLAEDIDHLLEIAHEHIEKNSLAHFYDQVLMPALILAEEDRHQGTLTLAKQRRIFQSCRELIEELGKDAPPDAPSESVAEGRVQVLGVPASDEADEIVGLMLKELLAAQGIRAHVMSAVDPTASLAEEVPLEALKVIFVSALPPSTLVSARQACRRLRGRFRSVPILLGVWAPHTPPTELQARLGRNEAHAVTTTLGSAVERIQDALAGRPLKTVAVEDPAAPAREDHEAKVAEAK